MMTKIDSKTQEQLIQAAKKAQKGAYAPYSAFYVGAAILFDDGSIVSGCNVENASYSLGICAERVACASAVAQGKMRPVAMAVVGSSEQTVAPCGACRQFLVEFNPSLPVIMLSSGGAMKQMTLDELLPEQFTRRALEK
jgi:cytidine deaminase